MLLKNLYNLCVQLFFRFPSPQYIKLNRISKDCSYSSAISAGALLDFVGWQTFNLILIPWLVFTGFALIWFQQKYKNVKIN